MKKIIILLFAIFLLTGCGKKYYCDPGYELKEDKCYRKIVEPAIEEYSCEKGDILDFKTCVKEWKSMSLVGMAPYFLRYCAVGRLEGLYCVSRSTYEPTINYTCNEGYTLETDTCVMEETKNANERWEL